VAYFIAGLPEQKRNHGIHIFAGSLNLGLIRRFFEMIYPGDIVIKRVIPLDRGCWIIIFGSHEMAQLIIQEGHGRLPLAKKRFPFFDLQTCLATNGDDGIYRINITWARRHKKMKKDE
jgi:hypothetical protein